MGIFKKKSEPKPETVKRIKEVARNPIRAQLMMSQLEEEKWEQRRWELTRNLVVQDRRSVVLGKLNASPQAIARNARLLADATIHELIINKPQSNGKETNNKTF